jgi:large subunit ribosomal protein L29
MAKQSKEISELTVSELQNRLRELKQESLNLRLQQATGQLENPARIRAVRRDSARVQTALTAKSNA